MFKPALIGALAILALSPAEVRAQSTTRPIAIVVPFTAGTGIDILARALGEEMQTRLARPVVVENKPGASGNIGTFAVARAAPDGNTLLLTAPSHVLSNNGPNRKFAYDAETSFAPIVQVAKGALALVVHKDVPAKALQEFIALAKSKPGAMNYASTGPMSAQHLAMELFKLATGTNIVHVPYSGAAGAVRDVAGGHVTGMFMPLHTALPLLQAGQIRALAIASPERSPLGPDIPTIKEGGIQGAEVELCYGLLAPAGTPHDIVERLNQTSNEILALPKVKEDLVRQGLVVVGGTQQQFARFIGTELRRWDKVIADAGLTQP